MAFSVAPKLCFAVVTLLGRLGQPLRRPGICTSRTLAPSDVQHFDAFLRGCQVVHADVAHQLNCQATMVR